jgi:hypothetical protein
MQCKTVGRDHGSVLCWFDLAGRNVDGAAWRETWSERLMYASNNLDTVVERNAHKWAADPSVSVSSADAAWLGCLLAWFSSSKPPT